MEAGTFSDKWNGGVRNSGAYRTPDFDISRRIGGGKAMDIASAPPVRETETDRSLAESRQLIERLRQLVADR